MIEFVGEFIGWTLLVAWTAFVVLAVASCMGVTP